MLKLLLKPIMISITFLAGFSILERFVINKKFKEKKIYSFLIELGYFIFFWVVVFVKFL